MLLTERIDRATDISELKDLFASLSNSRKEHENPLFVLSTKEERIFLRRRILNKIQTLEKEYVRNWEQMTGLKYDEEHGHL